MCSDEMEQSRAPTFLDLPDCARHSIYALSGLVRQCPINLSLPRSPTPRVFGCWHKERLRGVTSTFSSGSSLCECRLFPLELTLVCRRVREEALDVLLGANLFIIRALPGRPNMLAPVLDLIPTAHLARMTRLVIRLNNWPCPWGHDMQVTLPNGSIQCEPCRTDRREGHPALSRSSPDGLRMIEAWEDLCRRLGSGRQPNQTELTLICDVDDILTGHRIVDPLMNSLPSLRSCIIRLGRSSADGNLAKVARDTALVLTRSQPLQSTKPFPFIRLPRELRLNILKYTNLGPPELAGYSRDYTKIRVHKGRLVRGDHREYVPSRPVRKCCGECCDSFFDCCCVNLYASFSPRCTCRLLPMALFLVDRETRILALEAFYSNTGFTFSHDHLGAILDFLPAPALPLLRNITLVLTPAQCYHWNGHAPAPAHPAWMLDQIVAVYFPGCTPQITDSTQPSYHDTFKAIISTLASCSSTPIALEIDLWATYVFADEFMGDMDEDDEDRFRWTYDMYRDVAVALREAFGSETTSSRRRLKSLRFRLGTFTDLQGWLERDVLGGQRFDGVLQPEGIRRILNQRVPRYHLE